MTAIPERSTTSFRTEREPVKIKAEYVGVKVFHLVNGSPIIAKAELINNRNTFKLQDPLYIIYDGTSRDKDRPGEGTFKVNNLMILSDENEIEMDSRHVIFHYNPSADLLDHYNNILIKTLTAMDDNDK